ncbi:related to folate transporter/carrier (mitochondrial) [Cephalotrichum gorgonifer]|uniref:Related to folate transporter/carrier (Mitochondrial) n=1 Tax=Cephalotrichum gorgonifer TaxID=2041049 RepID=A0AAE8MPT7_9PEZI|nr:related to folate transporter/carrier (mitochondrial) [Cephalotrichum gorgonifer]
MSRENHNHNEHPHTTTQSSESTSTPDSATTATTTQYEARDLQDSPYALDPPVPFPAPRHDIGPRELAPSMKRHVNLTPFQRWTTTASDSQFHAAAGAIGGIASGVVTCPLDVIKTKLQAQGGFAPVAGAGGHVGHPKLYNGLFGTASTIWRHEGLRGMYRGLGPIVMGYLPTWAVWFTVYNKCKVELRQHCSNDFLINLCSSVVAGASSTIATNPIWVIKTRLMSQASLHQVALQYDVFPKSSSTPTSRPTLQVPWHYKSTLDAARKMYTSEGILSFYSGLTPALLGLTHVAVQFPVYEFLKTKFTGRPMGSMQTQTQTGEKTYRQLFGVLCATILSKIFASSATYPHEVIRTRLQTQRRPIAGEQLLRLGITPEAGRQAQDAGHAQKYRGVVQTFRTILREEGWRAFYAGMGTNMMRAVPAATVTMCTYEYCMSKFRTTRHYAEGSMAGRDGEHRFS